MAEWIVGCERVVVCVDNVFGMVVVVVGVLVVGVLIVPINPKVGEREFEHILFDSVFDVVFEDVDFGVSGEWLVELDFEVFVLIFYILGMIGLLKGVVLFWCVLVANFDALVDAWEWMVDDVVVYALLLFYVYGLIFGMFGLLRCGGVVWYFGCFLVGVVVEVFGDRVMMLFGVLMMYYWFVDEFDFEIVCWIG